MAIIQAGTREDLINLLHGAGIQDKLRDLGFGVLTPARGSNTLTCTPLYPPEHQRTVRDFFTRKWRTKRSGGLLFIEKLVVAFLPHVPDGTAGEVVLWLHDTALSDLEPVGRKVSLSLSGGPRLVAFYPNYSIPLSDSAESAPRCFSLVTQLQGIRLKTGSSAFSLLSMWNPVIGEKAQHYQATEPECVPIVRHSIKSSLQTLALQRQYLNAALTNPLGRSQRGSQSLRHPPLDYALSPTREARSVQIPPSTSSATKTHQYLE
nr:movement protein [Carrot mottle mimic virus]